MIVRTTILVTTFIVAGSIVFAESIELPLSVTSPDGRLRVTCDLNAQGHARFEVSRQDVPLISGVLGLKFFGSEPLEDQLVVTTVERRTEDVTYDVPVGKASNARNHYQELEVSLEEQGELPRRLKLVFRVFDDGVAFRYKIPKQASFDEFIVTQESTRLRFADNPEARFLRFAAAQTSYEDYYRTQRVRDIGSDKKPVIALPMVLINPHGIVLAMTEADLTDYAGAYLVKAADDLDAFDVSLAPLMPEQTPEGLPEGSAKVIGKTPFRSPWRVLMVSENIGNLIESNLVFNLNSPSKISDPSWIRPGKTTFPWWNHYVLEGVDFEPGVNTETMKYYIDFCAEQGIPYHSLDGLDIAWYGGPISPRGDTDVTTATKSIDMPFLLRYAKQKGVRLRLWVHWRTLAPQLEEAFETYERWGIEGVMIDFMDRDDQEMVRWYHRVAQTAAQHHLTVTWHGAYKPTGMERTWPNVLTYEAVLNQEYNKWDGKDSVGTPPKHNLDAAFVRMLAGPLDYHQGGMRSVLPEDYQFQDIAPPVQGTRGHQLAMYVVYQNHLPMMADDPVTYRKQCELKFMVEIPTNWNETRVLHADFGKCIVVARRRGDAWYVGGMTANEPHSLSLVLDFLDEGNYRLELYEDNELLGPQSVDHSTQIFQSSELPKLDVKMPRAGGFAAKIVRVPGVSD